MQKQKFNPKRNLFLRASLMATVLAAGLFAIQFAPSTNHKSAPFEAEKQVLGTKTVQEGLYESAATPETFTIKEEANIDHSEFDNFDWKKFERLDVHAAFEDSEIYDENFGETRDFAVRLLVETDQNFALLPPHAAAEGEVLGMRIDRGEPTELLIFGLLMFAVLAIAGIRFKYKKTPPPATMILALCIMGGMLYSVNAFAQDFTSNTANIGDTITYKIQYFNPSTTETVEDVRFNILMPKGTSYKSNSLRIEIDDLDPFNQVISGFYQTDENDADNANFNDSNNNAVLGVGNVPPLTWGYVGFQVTANNEAEANPKAIFKYNGNFRRLPKIVTLIESQDLDEDLIEDVQDCDASNPYKLFCDNFETDQLDILWNANNSFINNGKVDINKGESMTAKPAFANNKNEYLHIGTVIHNGDLKLVDEESNVGFRLSYNGRSKVKFQSELIDLKTLSPPVKADIYIKGNEAKLYVEDVHGEIYIVESTNEFLKNESNFKLTLESSVRGGTFDDVVVTRESDV